MLFNPKVKKGATHFFAEKKFSKDCLNFEMLLLVIWLVLYNSGSNFKLALCYLLNIWF